MENVLEAVRYGMRREWEKSQREGLKRLDGRVGSIRERAEREAAVAVVDG